MIAGQKDFFNDLPSGWTFDRLKDVVELRNEKTSEASEEEDYLELEDIEPGTGRILGKRNTLEVISAVTIFKKGDVLFGKLRPYLEKFYEAEFNGKCTGEILAFRPFKVNSRFLLYCFASRWFIEYCNALAYGAKMPRVSWPTQLAKFNIPLPPAKEQQLITDYLDASCAGIDAAILRKQKQLEILKQTHQIVIYQTITTGLDLSVQMQEVNEHWFERVPSHWKASRVKNVADLSPGYSGFPPSREDYCTVVPMELLSESGEINTTNQQQLSEIMNGLTLFEKGDVLFAKITPCMENGKGAYVSDLQTKYAFGSTEFHVLRPKHNINGLFLYYFLHNQIFREYAERHMTGAAGQKRVPSRFLKEARLFLPPMEEQIEIVEFLTKQKALFTSLLEQISKQLNTLLAYRRSLIHECVTGQRRVTEADVKKVREYGC